MSALSSKKGPSVLFCRFCDQNFLKFMHYLHHLPSHRHIIGTKLPCGVKDCLRMLANEAALRRHLIHEHSLLVRKLQQSSTVSPPLDSQARLQCSISSCAAILDSSRALMAHLGMHMKAGRPVKCPFPLCDKKYSLIGSMTGHISKSHRTGAATVPDQNTPMDSENPDDDLMYADELLGQQEQALVPVTMSIAPTWAQSLAEFFLRLEFKYLIPERTVQFIAEEMHLLHVQASKELIRNSLDSSLPLEKSFSKLEESFITLKTSARRLTFYKDHFLFNKPEKLSLGNGKFFYYVSIKETLKKMMQSKSCIVDLRPPKFSNDGIIRDFYDGLLFHQSTFFGENPVCFHIMLFQDAFEPVNPLGSAKQKYKTLGIYLTLGNISEHLRTHPDSIQLVALCKEKDLNHDIVFGRIADELKELESVGVFIPGYGMVKGGLVYVCGDNLGSHGVGGFVENFATARYFCRYCLVDRRVFVTEKGHCMDYPERTKESYIVALQGRTLVQKKGVKFNSKLNNLQHYHVCNPGLPPCLGHDVLEGVAAYDLALILHYMVQDEWCTYEDINEKIESFPYSKRDRRDKPIPFKEDYTKVKGKMWQIYNAIRLFPIMLAEFVEDEMHPAWQMLLSLGRLLDILCAPALHKSWAAYVRSVVWEYLDLRMELFPFIPLRPKHHYLTHYWLLLLWFGPLGKVWTLRFESKHCFFKNCIRSSKNFINILFSFSNRHEMFQAFLRAGGDARCNSSCGKSSPFFPEKFSPEIRMAVFRAVSLNDLRQCTSVVLRGTQFQKGNILPLSQSYFEYEVVFGRILLILFQNEDSPFFLLEVLKSEFIPISRAYALGAKQRIVCFPYCDLPTYFPLYSYNYNGTLLVKLKHSMVLQDANS